MFLVLLILGESFLGWYIAFFLLALLSTFYNKIDIVKINQFKNLFILWLIFLLFLFVSTFSSVSIPLSLNALIFYNFSFLIFFFFLLLRERFLHNSWVILGFLSIAVVLCLMAIIFFILPDIAKLLPGVNIFYSSYGHNHLASYLLLVLPASWYFALKAKQKYLLVLPIFLTLSLMFSFGRVAIVIGIAQFLAIMMIFRKKIFSSRFFKINFYFISLTFLLASLILIFFSSKISSNQRICSYKPIKRMLCKSLSTDSRLYYWQQAISIFKDNVFFGLGPGTYSLGSEKYMQTPEYYSGFAHSAFLQNFAELGVFGGLLFFALMTHLLFLAWKKVKRHLRSLEMALFIGFLSIFINAFFDFDWSFIGIYSLSLIWVALILKRKKRERALSKKTSYSKKKKHVLAEKFFKIMSPALQRVQQVGLGPTGQAARKLKKLNKIFIYLRFFSFAIIITLTFLYFFVEIIFKIAGHKAAFSFFPYIHWHSQIFAESKDLLAADHWRLQKIYQHHPEIYQILIKNEVDENERYELKQKLFLLQPWQRVLNPVVAYHLEKNDLTQAEVELDEIQHFVFDKKQAYDYNVELIPVNTRKEFANNFLFFAEQYLEQGKYSLAGDYYLKAQFFQEWIFSDHRSIFLENFAFYSKCDSKQASNCFQIIFFNRIKDPNFIQFLKKISIVYAESFGNQRPFYSLLFLNTLNREIIAGEIENVDFLTKKILALKGVDNFKFWETTASVGLESINDAISRNDWNLATMRAELLFKVWKNLEPYKEEINKDKQRDFAEILVKIADHRQNVANEKALKSDCKANVLYDYAKEIFPWIVEAMHS